LFSVRLRPRGLSSKKNSFGGKNDEHVTFRIGLGPGGTMVTMARAILYLLDENKKIKEERDEYFILSQ
jgi:hypothetical protein